MERIYRSREISVGNLKLGGDNPIRVQSMTNTDTMDTAATVRQTLELVEAGCELVRITAPDVKAAQNLYDIKNELLKRGCNVPLIADIHFNPQAAEVAAGIVEKVRVNPGNYVDRNSGKTVFTDKEYDEELSRIAERMSRLVEICKAHGTAMRIGVNHGSLSERIVSRWGDTPLGMAVSAIEFAKVCSDMDFGNLVFSMKSSNVKAMVYSTRLFVQKMVENGFCFPVHLGVTEAGDAMQGRIKSAVGIGTLLLDGIGDTIRVSLTESPVAEIPVARKILADIPRKEVSFKELKNLKTMYSSDRDARPAVWSGDSEISEDRYLQLAAVYGKKLIDGETDCLDENHDVFREIMQAAGVKNYRAEYIACPSCGRTQYNIQEALQEIKAATVHLKGLKIGVMGCIVNGPGEMADADYGYVGSGKGKITLYKKKEVVARNIDQKDAVEQLVQLIKQNGDWVEP